MLKYRFTTVNSKGKKNRSAFRNCKVKDTAMVTAGGKEYPSYKVHCYEHHGERTFYYSPAVRVTVYMERHPKRGRKRVMEYLGDL